MNLDFIKPNSQNAQSNAEQKEWLAQNGLNQHEIWPFLQPNPAVSLKELQENLRESAQPLLLKLNLANPVSTPRKVPIDIKSKEISLMSSPDPLLTSSGEQKRKKLKSNLTAIVSQETNDSTSSNQPNEPMMIQDEIVDQGHVEPARVVHLVKKTDRRKSTGYF